MTGNITPRVNPAYPTQQQGGSPLNIPDGSVTLVKIQNVNADTVLGGINFGPPVMIPFTAAARQFAAAADQNAQRDVLGIPSSGILTRVTSSSLTVTGSPLPNAAQSVDIELPSVGNSTVLGIGSGGSATAKPILLVAGSGVTITPNAANITISASGSGGNVSGPGSSLNGSAALFNGITGQLIEDSKVFITIPAGNATLTIDNGFTLHATANATVSGTNTGDQTITLTGDVTGSGTGSIACELDTTGVSAATYGDSTHVGQFTVDTDGRITSASNVAISGSGSASEVLLATSSPTGTNVATFNNISTLIPAGFTPKRLIVKASAKSTAAATTFGIELQIRFNNDSGANYDRVLTQQIGGSAPGDNSLAAATQMTFGYAADAGANTQGFGEIEVFNYLDTTAHKICRIHGGLINGTATGNMIGQPGAGGWRSNAAIDRIDVLVSGGNYGSPTFIELLAGA